MKRIELDSPSVVPHFIGSWFIENLSLCETLIDFFETQKRHQTQGQTAGGMNLEAKNSIDLSIRPRDLEAPDHQPVRDYIDALFACYKDYLEQWPFLKSVLPRVELGSFNIQRYQPGGHFLKIHSERTTVGTSHRVLAWMTYLNDVNDGGSTRFVHQDLEVQPQRGKTLIWPAEWTHAHQGNVVNSGTKYIITGWMHFPRSG
ncbi:MAG: 2OG-Fe(II) oxygenase [Gammaproteobacteria bacterium]|nr:2OG-Fe(II) oxygenase [Gammaproteobacteria bacterium]